MLRAALTGSALIALLISAAPRAAAEADRVPPTLRAAILLRAVAYERGYASGDTPAVVAVVGPARGPGRRDADEMAAAFAEIGQRVKVSRRRLRVVRLTHPAAPSTREALHRLEPDVVYIAPGLTALWPSLDDALLRGVIVLCGTGEDLDRGGVLAVERAGEASRLVVNMARMRRLGLRFDPRLLKLARRVGG